MTDDNFRLFNSLDYNCYKIFRNTYCFDSLRIFLNN